MAGTAAARLSWSRLTIVKVAFKNGMLLVVVVVSALLMLHQDNLAGHTVRQSLDLGARCVTHHMRAVQLSAQ